MEAGGAISIVIISRGADKTRVLGQGSLVADVSLLHALQQIVESCWRST